MARSGRARTSSQARHCQVSKVVRQSSLRTRLVQGRGSHGANGAIAPPTYTLWRHCLSSACSPQVLRPNVTFYKFLKCLYTYYIHTHYLATILVQICLYCLNCSNFGQLILRKITKIVATRCHILRPTLIVPYELYELYDWGKVPELYGTL